MAGFLDKFREKIVGSNQEEAKQDIDDKIALGVLCWVVAEADEKFLPQEKDVIKKILKEANAATDDDIDCVLKSIEIAADERIDLYTFTQEVSEGLPRPNKIAILENLFRLACSDGDLDEKEHEMIRKISGLFRLDHKEFIDSKIKIKKECGLDTVA